MTLDIMALLLKLRIKTREKYYMQRFASDLPHTWPLLRKIWMADKVVYSGRAGHLLHTPIAVKAAWHASQWAGAADFFSSHVEDRDPRVVLHILLILEKININKLELVKKLVRHRTEYVRMISGHSFIEMALGEFTEIIGKEAVELD